MRPYIRSLVLADRGSLVLSHDVSAGLLTVVSGPGAGLVRTARLAQLWLSLSMQPFQGASLGILTAWRSLGNQTEPLASPQTVVLKQNLKLEASSRRRPGPGNRQHILPALVIGQSSPRPAHIQGGGTEAHLSVEGVPSLFCYPPRQCLLLLKREPEGLLQAGAKISGGVSVIPNMYEADFLMVDTLHSSRPQRVAGAHRLKSSDGFQPGQCSSPGG